MLIYFKPKLRKSVICPLGRRKQFFRNCFVEVNPDKKINVPSLKSSFTPKSPKGDFPKLLIFSVLPLGLGAKTIKISSLEAF